MKSILVSLIILVCFVAIAQNNKRDIDSIENRIKMLSDKNEILIDKAGLVMNYFSSGDQKKANQLYQQTLNEALTQGSDLGLGALYHCKGNLFYYESQFDSALYYFEKALVYRKKSGDNVGILKTTGNIGSIYFMMTNYKQALIYYEATQKKEAELKYEEGKYFSINNLGYIYARLRMYTKALHYFKKAEGVYLKNSKNDQLIFTYDGLSTVYKELDKPDSALYFEFKSKDLSEITNDQTSLNYALTSIGILYQRKRDFIKAKAYFNQALALARKFNDQRLQLSIYGNFAAIALEQNLPDSAMQYVALIIPLQRALKDNSSQEDLAKLFAEYYHKKKDFEKAYDYIQIYDHYKDSLYNLETTRQITEIQEKYETDKKEKENQLLQADNTMYRSTRNYLLVILGIALLGIIGAYVAYKKIKSAKHLLEEQKELIEEKQKEILDSIHYAKRIQFALLASDTLLTNYLPEHFVLFKPKDVVSGDFYWACPSPEGFIYITADCTGHGVPGAFMSLLNISKLSQTINESKIYRCDHILNAIRSEIIKVLNPHGSSGESKDGMDAVVCKLDLKNMKLEYAAANNSFYIIRDNNLLVCKADKMSVGKGFNDSLPFSYNEIALLKGDIIYTFTDGFADQFGGPLGKKYKYKAFEEFLLSIHQKNLTTQKELLLQSFNTWKGDLEQVDDVCVLAVKV